MSPAAPAPGTSPQHASPGPIEQYEDRLNTQTTLLLKQVQRSPLAVLAVVGIVVYALPSAIDTWRTWSWFGMVALALCTRYLYAIGIQGRCSPASAPGIMRNLTLFALVNGLAVGISAPLFFEYLPDASRAMVAMVLVGLSAGGIATSAGYPPVFSAYILPALLPLALSWALIGGTQYRLIGVMVLLFILILYSFVRQNHKLLQDSFGIRFEREQLIQELKAKQEELLLAMAQAREATVQAEVARGQAEAAKEQAELAKEQSETARTQAEEAGRAKARVLAAASHDLRQPLHALSLYSAVLSNHPEAHTLNEVSQQIDLSVRALRALLNALLDISRLDAGVYQIEETSFSASEILARIVAEFQPLAQKKNLMLYLDKKPAQTWSDPVVFEQIARNLLDNAIKYTEAGAVLVSVRIEDERIHIAVRDTGRGIPESELARVFEEFYQIDNPGRNRELGLGLGLSIVKRLATLIRSEIRLSSVVDEGSSFSWHIPLERRGKTGLLAVNEEESVATMSNDKYRRQILVIEDETAIRHGMSLLLKTWGMDAHGTDGRAGADQILQRHGIDLVIADLRLQDGENGLQVVNALRQTWKNLPVLLISGETDPDQLRDVAASGFPLMNKPIQADMLRKTLFQLLDEPGAPPES